MQGMSEREYAAHAGLSRGVIQKAKSSGRLALHADGSMGLPRASLRPATPAGMYLLRCSLCAEHSSAQVGDIIEMFAAAGRATGCID